jgi:hypothetical protein
LCISRWLASSSKPGRQGAGGQDENERMFRIKGLLHSSWGCGSRMAG